MHFHNCFLITKFTNIGCTWVGLAEMFSEVSTQLYQVIKPNKNGRDTRTTTTTATKNRNSEYFLLRCFTLFWIVQSLCLFWDEIRYIYLFLLQLMVLIQWKLSKYQQLQRSHCRNISKAGLCMNFNIRICWLDLLIKIQLNSKSIHANTQINTNVFFSSNETITQMLVYARHT